MSNRTVLASAASQFDNKADRDEALKNGLASICTTMLIAQIIKSKGDLLSSEQLRQLRTGKSHERYEQLLINDPKFISYAKIDM